jgi:hypothetical protein
MECKYIPLVKHKEKKMEREIYNDYLETLSTRDPKKMYGFTILLMEYQNKNLYYIKINYVLFL